jgi:hypothetical protein
VERDEAWREEAGRSPRHTGLQLIGAGATGDMLRIEANTGGLVTALAGRLR